MTVKIKIERLTDHNECETCGGGYDDGGRIWVDGELVWEKIPLGSCYDGEYLEDSFYFIEALKHLSVEVEFDC